MLLGDTSTRTAFWAGREQLGDTTEELAFGYVPILMAIYNLRFVPISDFWVAHMLWPLVWCAAVALLGVGLLWGVRKRTHSNDPDTA